MEADCSDSYTDQALELVLVGNLQIRHVHRELVEICQCQFVEDASGLLQCPSRVIHMAARSAWVLLFGSAHPYKPTEHPTESKQHQPHAPS